MVFQRALQFDAEFPQYGTRNGVLPHTDPLVAMSSPALWADALDRFLHVLATESDLDLSDLRAVSGAAQQHGSVFLNGAATARLAALDPVQPLAPQVGPMLSRLASPIWMDSSTSTQCADITRALGSGDALARLTGSRAFERFTGPQIRKYAEQDPAGYAGVDRIHLVSSFLASLLVGSHAPTEPGDAAGMNLMDLAKRTWAPEALRATAPDLARRLPAIVPSSSVIGRLSRYWMERHRLPAARVITWTGDNPSSAIGVGLIAPELGAISLGTSDTLFGLLEEPRVDPSGAGHVFGAATGDGDYLALVCFKNGALARERVRDAFGLDWDGFSRLLRETPPGNGGAMMLPWFEPEITPPAPAGVRRHGLDPDDAPRNVRAVIEGQMLAMALHGGWIGARVTALHATGGAARNREILQVMADVHSVSVYPLDVTESAALGAALRAFHGDQLAEGRTVSWDEVTAGFVVPAARLDPDPHSVAVYGELKKVYAAYGAAQAATRRGP